MKLTPPCVSHVIPSLYVAGLANYSSNEMLCVRASISLVVFVYYFSWGLVLMYSKLRSISSRRRARKATASLGDVAIAVASVRNSRFGV